MLTVGNILTPIIARDRGYTTIVSFQFKDALTILYVDENGIPPTYIITRENIIVVTVMAESVKQYLQGIQKSV